VQKLSDKTEKYLYRVLEHKHVEESARIFPETELCKSDILFVEIFTCMEEVREKINWIQDI